MLNFLTKKEKAPKVITYTYPKGWKSALLLTLSLCVFIAALILKFMVGTNSQSELEELAKVETEKQIINKTPSYLEVKSIENVGTLDQQVKPVSFDAVLLEQRNQDTAFQDSEFIAERKNAWTIQVMDVSNIDIIKDYLATQEKRSQFAYFRYVSDDKTKRYILTFDDFNDKTGAQKAIANIDFDLPDSITPFPKAFKDYLKIVEQYHLENKVKEYRRSRYREVNLKKTRAPVYYIQAD